MSGTEGRELTYSAYNTHRAGFNHLFRMYDELKPEKLEEDLKKYFKSLKKKQAKARQAGTADLKSNTKHPLPFSVYHCLARNFMRGNAEDSMTFTFAHLYLLLAWNTMQRAATIAEISLKHMDWSNDALQIFVFQAKNDQEGDKAKYPKHVFANPVNPAICPILSLGIYFLLVDFRTENLKLFDGSQQDERFRQFLQRVTDIPAIAEDLRSLGFDKEKLGIHSTRKGAATYCASGSTAAPHQAAIDIRGGWSQGRIKDVYQHYLATGDQYVGRTICGLPRNSAEFAILPPRFASGSNEPFIRDAINTCFPSLPETNFMVGRFALASLVYHSDFLRQNLPANHLLFSTMLFRNCDLLDALKPMVLCTLATSCNEIQGTGIPPDIHITCAVDKIPGRVDELLQERSILANQVTPDLVTNLFQQSYAQMRSLLQPPENAGQDATAMGTASTTLTTWGGKLRFLPRDYVIPKVPCRVIWEHWWLGDKPNNIPALKLIPKSNIHDSQARRFSDLKYLVKELSRLLEENESLVANPSPLQVTQMYEKAVDLMELDQQTSKKRTRRNGQLLWTTVVKHLRQKNKST